MAQVALTYFLVSHCSFSAWLPPFYDYILDLNFPEACVTYLTGDPPSTRGPSVGLPAFITSTFSISFLIPLNIYFFQFHTLS